MIVMKKIKHLLKKLSFHIHFLILLFIIFTSNVSAISLYTIEVSCQKFNNNNDFRERMITSQSYEIQGKIINKEM